MNPLDYHPAQIAKALVALLTSTITILGVVAAALADGGLGDAGLWVAGVAAFLVTPLVFLKRAAPVIDLFDRRSGEAPDGADLAAGD